MVFVIFASIFSAIFVFCLCILCFNRLFANRIITKDRLDETEHMDRLGDEQKSAFSLEEALIRPALSSLIAVFTVFVPNNPEFLKKTDEQLRQAGIRMEARNYQAAVALFTVFMVILCAVGGYFYQRVPLHAAIGVVAGFYIGFTFSRFNLTSKISKRNKEIHQQMPEMMDLLSVSVSAGLGFDQALGYVVQKSEGALFDEIAIAQREISLGRTRREALSALSDRCGDLEMKTFVSAVLQADEMGASMQNVLQIQADTIRLAHKQAVEESAQKLSVKMLFPLVVCIFPVILLVLMGPAALSIMDNLMGAT